MNLTVSTDFVRSRFSVTEVGAAYPPCFSYGVLAPVCACAMLGWLEMLKAILD